MLDGLAGWIVPFNRNPWSSISIPWPHGIAWIRCHVNKVQGGSAVERVGGRTCDSTLLCGAVRLFRPRRDLHLPTMPLSRPFFPCARTLRRQIG